MTKKALLVGTMLVFSSLPVWAAGQQVVELHWEEIPPLIEGQEIALVLPDATHLQGKVLAVRPDSLEIDVKKTANPRLHPKGQTTIPRSSVSVIELRKMRKFPIGAIAGGVAGYLGGVSLGFGIATIATNEDVVLPRLGVMVGAVAGAIVGGRVGHNLDRKNTLIKVIPEAPDAEKLPDPTQTGSEIMELDDYGLPVSGGQTEVRSEFAAAESKPMKCSQRITNGQTV